MNTKQEAMSLKISLGEDVAQGMYINLAVVNHNETEFTLDMLYVQPHEPKATVRARIITSPKHTKRLVEALRENLERYEARFGKVDIAAPAAEVASEVFQ